MAKPKPIAERTFTRRPTPAELAHIIAELGLDVPVYKTRAVGGRLELYLYSGLVVTLGLNAEPVYHDLAEGPPPGDLGPPGRAPEASKGPKQRPVRAQHAAPQPESED
jgi:hypothetical protein